MGQAVRACGDLRQAGPHARAQARARGQGLVEPEDQAAHASGKGSFPGAGFWETMQSVSY